MFRIKYIAVFTSVLLTFSSCEEKKIVSADLTEESPLTYFDLKDVSLLESPFKHAQDLDKKYLLALEADKLLAPFLREAGLTPKAESYPNWENTGLDGHIGGHYLSALSLMYAATGDKEIKERLDYMIAELKKCQEANGNGYIGGVPDGKTIWKEIKEGNIRAGGFSLNDKWVPLYNIHKTFSGLRDVYVYTGSKDAKEMLVAMTDWAIDLVANLTDEQIQEMLISEHGGLNEAFADVADMTGDVKYMKLAKQFSHKEVLDPLLDHEDKLTGMHANTQIPKVIGFERIAQINNNKKWASAASFFWDDVVNERSVVIGGNSAYEHFHPKDNFSKMIQGTQGPETCNTYNMLKLTKMLYEDTGNESYIAYYEKALYNHILSTQNPETGGLVYFTQMRPGHYRVYSQVETSFWCCVGSGIENHGKYGEMVYAHTNQSLLVNLFIPSSVIWHEKGVELVQVNNFPTEAATHFKIKAKAKTNFTLRLRLPAWTYGGASLTINGEEYKDFDANAPYINIEREWNDGDEITYNLPMSLSTEQLKDGSNYYSFLYGPIVLAAKTSTDNQDGLFADASRGGHIASGEIVSLKEIPTVVGNPDSLVNQITKEDTEDLRFKIGGLYHTEAFTDSLELEPFYALHESRYMIYFPQATKDGLKAMQEKMEKEEAAARVLEEKSSDVVYCGEQQPESDHSIEQKDTWTGYDYESHWREGGGYFSYNMRNNESMAKYLYIDYLDIDKLRACEFYVGGVKVGELKSNGEADKPLNTVVFDLPEEVQQMKDFRVEIKAIDNLWMPKIVEVRILKESL
ncbi:glycoside hydrolase family 127 protein [Neptunitalea lumnitzerae]|uniref:Glycosyl hydrolase n=1 Tax=Neptunitalea lumnitzerae TaxID=2965509 RepID=A0ABQ5MK70_9FLAO|nr:glycoside hydrolase family 127 protein [Neptunitalea sp. Y10]GLB49779.1 glycosyl hydrolase [Neptunitalea sp. Y10]